MSAVFVLACYAALLAQFGWPALLAIVGHVGIMLAAASRPRR